MPFFFPRGVLDEILNLIESVSEGFPSYFFIMLMRYQALDFISVKCACQVPSQVKVKSKCYSYQLHLFVAGSCLVVDAKVCYVFWKIGDIQT